MAAFPILDSWIKERLSELPPGTASNPLYVTEEEVTALLQENSSAETAETKLPGLETVSTIFGLDATERYVLLFLLAPELDRRDERIYAFLANDLTLNFPTLSLLLTLLGRNADERHLLLIRLTTDSPLRRFGLIRMDDPGDTTPLMRRPLTLEPSVRNALLGRYHPDSRLESCCRFLPLPEQKHPDATTEALRRAVSDRQRFVVNLHGDGALQKERQAAAIAAAFDFGLLSIDTPLVLELFEENAALLTLLYREAMLSGCLLYFENFDAWLHREQAKADRARLFTALDQFSWLTFFASAAPWRPVDLPPSQHLLSLPFSHPRYPESARLWEQYLGGIDGSDLKEVAESLAQRFSFAEEEMATVSRQLESERLFGREITPKLLYDTCRQRITTDLSELAQPIRSANSLDDIVLPDEQKQQLEQVLTHYRNQFGVFEEWGFKKHFQSQGIGVLFTGAPGTGKTMAAAILANALGLELYRIELSQVVSKYIGETEKNLSKIFATAEHSGVVLFFDEADAIFGKRTEVRDAHDRYANIEVSYLLQKIEEYDGLVILASNFRKNIDDAFVRRMRFIVEFALPDAEMREAIWRKIFPPAAPLDPQIDFGILARRFRLSGAHIRNIALSAAFLARERSETISISHILEGTEREYRKIGENFTTPPDM